MKQQLMKNKYFAFEWIWVTDQKAIGGFSRSHQIRKGSKHVVLLWKKESALDWAKTIEKLQIISSENDGNFILVSKCDSHDALYEVFKIYLA